MSWTALAAASLLASSLLPPIAAAGLAVTPRGDLTLQELGPAGGALCLVGNGGEPAWIVSDVLAAPQQYEVVFDPFDGCADCVRDGYRVSMIHVGVQVSSACVIVMDVGLGNVHPDEGASCPLLGGEVCAAGLFSVEIPRSGLWDIGIPVECACLAVEGGYLLSVYFDDITCEDGKMPNLLTEYFPSFCENWLYDGEGWIDLLAEDPTWPGDLSIWADAVCCASTPAGLQSWSTLKGLFQ